MKVYLDNNIFIYLEQNELSILDLEKTVGSHITNIYYSPAHIRETIEIKGQNTLQEDERIMVRLETLDKFTNNKYLLSDSNHNIYEIISRPTKGYQTLKEVPFAVPSMKSIVNMVPEEQKNLFRSMLGVDSKTMNNYSPEQVIEQLSKEIPNAEGMNFLQLYEKAKSYFSDGSSFGLPHKIASLFDLLDLIGYWKDKYTEKSNYARSSDAGHCYYASYCDYFLTNDLRTFYKSKITYQLLGIKTEAILQKINNKAYP